MKFKISVSLLVSLLFMMLLIPVSIGADDGKSILKEMVQAPEDYSVGFWPDEYLMHWGLRYFFNPFEYPRQSWFDGRYYRLISPPITTVPCQVQFPSNPDCQCLFEIEINKTEYVHIKCSDIPCKIFIGDLDDGFLYYYCFELIPKT